MWPKEQVTQPCKWSRYDAMKAKVQTRSFNRASDSSIWLALCILPWAGNHPAAIFHVERLYLLSFVSFLFCEIILWPGPDLRSRPTLILNSPHSHSFNHQSIFQFFWEYTVWFTPSSFFYGEFFACCLCARGCIWIKGRNYGDFLNINRIFILIMSEFTIVILGIQRQK